MKYLFTSESVTEGHPDKICDQIADKILDEALKIDKNSHMAVEATIKGNTIFIYGEASSNANLNYKNIAKKVVYDIGYIEEFDVIEKISKQSSEINSAVSKDETMAGDQGIMFGYATDETKELMPLPIVLAHALTKKLDEERKKNKNSHLKPDGKSQVTIEYEDFKPKRIDTIVISIQHDKNITQSDLKKYVKNNIIDKVIPQKLVDDNTKYLINPGGSFTIGGPFADSGTTGRKIMVDTYGGMARSGGGCFSSKDPSKVDRSAAYYSRYVAKNIVANNLAKKCEIQVSYAIGKKEPISIFIDTFNTNKIPISEIYNYVEKNFDFSVSNIIKELDLLNVEYYPFAAHGHFGRLELNPSWEQIK